MLNLCSFCTVHRIFDEDSGAKIRDMCIFLHRYNFTIHVRTFWTSTFRRVSIINTHQLIATSLFQQQVWDVWEWLVQSFSCPSYQKSSKESRRKKALGKVESSMTRLLVCSTQLMPSVVSSLPFLEDTLTKCTDSKSLAISWLSLRWFLV